MNYPDDFNVPTFSAGKSIAVSRAMGIGIMSGFLLIIFLCGLLIWTIRSVHVEPYIIATGGINDQWQIIKPGGERPEIEMTAPQAVQISVLWKFVQNWFSISNNSDTNAAIWNTKCQRADCDTYDASNSCAIYCATSDNLFTRFRNDILPTYTNNAKLGEYWTPVVNSILITPVDNIIDAGGTWRIQMAVAMPDNKFMNVLAYAKIAQNIKSYPKTMGYYIVDFNAYRTN